MIKWFKRLFEKPKIVFIHNTVTMGSRKVGFVFKEHSDGTYTYDIHADDTVMWLGWHKAMIPEALMAYRKFKKDQLKCETNTVEKI